MRNRMRMVLVALAVTAGIFAQPAQEARANMCPGDCTPSAGCHYCTDGMGQTWLCNGDCSQCSLVTSSDPMPTVDCKG
jgi:hypothetical protein